MTAVHRYQSAAELSASVAGIQVVWHDLGEAWGQETWLDIYLQSGEVRLSSLHDSEFEVQDLDMFHAVTTRVPAGTRGSALAAILDEMPPLLARIAAGSSCDEFGMGDLTDDGMTALRDIRHLVETLEDAARCPFERYRDLVARLRLSRREIAVATGYSLGSVRRWGHAGASALPPPERAIHALAETLRIRAERDLAECAGQRW